MSFGIGSEFDRLETALEAADIAWWWMELPSGAVFFSPNKAHMLSRDPKDFRHYKDFTNLVHPDDHDRIMQDMKNHLSGQAELYETTYRIKAKDGSYKKFYDRGRVVSQRDGETILAGFVFDITNFDMTKKFAV